MVLKPPRLFVRARLMIVKGNRIILMRGRMFPGYIRIRENWHFDPSLPSALLSSLHWTAEHTPSSRHRHRRISQSVISVCPPSPFHQSGTIRLSSAWFRSLSLPLAEGRGNNPRDSQINGWKYVVRTSLSLAQACSSGPYAAACDGAGDRQSCAELHLIANTVIWT